MRRLMLLLGLGLVTACTGRQVEVTTGAEPASEAAISLRVTNELAQPVNVYVVQNGTEMFVRQVAANATEVVAVRGVARRLDRDAARAAGGWSPQLRAGRRDAVARRVRVARALTGGVQARACGDRGRRRRVPRAAVASRNRDG